MTPERPIGQRPYEQFGITQDEVSRWRVSDGKLTEILTNPNTTIHEIKVSSNNYGEFIFMTTSTGVGLQRTCMTFWGLGYHEYRERWIHQEWFWHQTPAESVDPQYKISQEDAFANLEQRRMEISPQFDEYTQTEQGRMFEALADMTDDDAALAEMQDLGLL